MCSTCAAAPFQRKQNALFYTTNHAQPAAYITRRKTPEKEERNASIFALYMHYKTMVYFLFQYKYTYMYSLICIYMYMYRYIIKKYYIPLHSAAILCTRHSIYWHWLVSSSSSSALCVQYSSSSSVGNLLCAVSYTFSVISRYNIVKKNFK